MSKRRETHARNGILAGSYDVVEPRAAALIESLRAFGYTLPAAVADLVDNSISAQANNIWLNFVWNGADSYISIADDGWGMTQKRLVEAMRPGSQSPLEARDPSDLGRFGLGLKTASFSQCRRITVRSQPKEGKPSTRSWDLDYVNQTGEWRLLKDGNANTISRVTGPGNRPHGTTVLWEVLDRVVEDDDPDDADAQQRFLALVDDVEAHLAVVFHRFMLGSRPLRIYINGADKDRLVRPWSPFLEDHSATQLLQSERIPFQRTLVKVLPFVLPHHDKLEPHVFQFASGPRGWNAHQGFYVYRNKRLLVAGDWLGLGYCVGPTVCAQVGEKSQRKYPGGRKTFAVGAAYRCRLGEYDSTTALEKLGSLISAAAAAGFATHRTRQTEAWQSELEILGCLATRLAPIVTASCNWWLLLEYEIPRRGKRPDAILLADDLVIVIEFKIGAMQFSREDEWQVVSYALISPRFPSGQPESENPASPRGDGGEVR